MITLLQKKIIKIISLSVSILLVWQSIVWADPDIFKQNTLAPRSLLNLPDKADSFLHVLARNIEVSLAEFEQDPNNHFVPEMLERVKEVLAKYKGEKVFSKDLLDKVLSLDERIPDGAFIINLGDYCIRYYSPGDGNEKPSFRCQILGDKEIGSGRYLAKQKLRQETSSDSFVARGDQLKLYQTFLNKRNQIKKLGHPHGMRLSRAKETLLACINNAKWLTDEERSAIESAIWKSFNANFIVFDAVVLLDEVDKTKTKGWMLGFNTLDRSNKWHEELEHRLSMLLKNMFPNTIGLAREALAFIGSDEDLFNEYLLHEIICPHFGHNEARKIQEKLFPENYYGWIIGDKKDGHKDGELGLVFKKVIYQKRKMPAEEEINDDTIKQELERFRKRGFMGKDPEKANAFYFTLFKKYRRQQERRWKTVQSRKYPIEQRQRARKIMREITELDNYIFAKLQWIWEMALGWEKIANILDGTDIYQLAEEKRNRARSIATEVIAKHKGFLRPGTKSAQLLQKDRSQMEEALQEVYKIAGLIRRKLVYSDAADPQDRPSPPVEYNQPRGPLKETLSFINWRGLRNVVLAGLALSVVLYFILPVNSPTVLIALVVPLTLFIYLMIKHWSWKNLLVAVGISLVLSALLPVRWLGLSMAIVIITQMYLSRRKTRMLSTPQTRDKIKKVDKDEHIASASREAEKPPQEVAETEKSSQKDENAILENNNISIDILALMLTIISIMHRGKTKSKRSGQLNTRNVLDAIFRLGLSPDYQEDIDLKNTLRNPVYNKLEEFEGGYIFDIKASISKLQSWKELSDEELAKALQEISQEVSREVSVAFGDEETKKEMMAIQELIGEYYGIEKSRFHQIRLRLDLIALRENVISGEITGSVKAKDYYELGRTEFYFGNYSRAEEAFEKAAMSDSTNTDYWLTLGIVKHFSKKWDKAKDAYENSLRLRRIKKPLEEVDNLKIKLAELLAGKVKDKITLTGEKGDVGGSSGPEQSGPEEKPSQMGKDAFVKNVRITEDGRVEAEIEDINANTHTIGLNHWGTVDISGVKLVIEYMKDVDEGHKEMILSILSLLENSPPGLYTYTKDDLIKDLFGFSSPEHNLIALYENLVADPVALFHEIAHYLLDIRITSVRGGLLDLKLTRRGGRLFIRIRGRNNIMGGFKDIGEVELSEEILDFIEQEKRDQRRQIEKHGREYKGWENWQNDHHYLLRVFQKAVFKGKDEKFTDILRANRKTTRRRKASEPDTARIHEWDRIENSINALPLPEGHAHFGGSIYPEDLWKLALMRDDIDWTEMNKELGEVFRRKIDLNFILKEARKLLEKDKLSRNDETKLKRLKNEFFAITQYKPEGEGELVDFVVVYKVAGMLSKGPPDIIKQVAKKIALSHYKDGLRLLELRISLPEGESRVDLYKKTLEKINALIAGLKEAEEEVNSGLDENEVGLETRVVVTVERNKAMKTISYQTNTILKILEDYPNLREYVVGYDVANPEQLKMPAEFIDIFKKIKRYNDKRGIEGEPKLGLTYHSGEEFGYTSVESAIRHVHEVIDLGVGRIGHGLVLGVNVDQFQIKGIQSKEHISERISQIYYDLRCAKFDEEGLRKVGLDIEESVLRAELGQYQKEYRYLKKTLMPKLESILERDELNREEEEEFLQAVLKMKKLAKSKDKFVITKYDTERCRRLIKRQNYVLNKVIERGVVIETNPTSNVYIGPIATFGQHPIKKFLTYQYPGEEGESTLAGLKPIITVNTDDAGVFGTTLTNEYMAIVKALNLTEDDVKTIIVNGFRHRLSHHPLRFQKQIMSSLGPEVQRKLAGYQIASTRFGDIQFTVPSETIKDIVKRVSRGEPFPTTFVLPPNLFVRGYNYVDMASVICFFIFKLRNGLKINIVLSQEQELALRDYLEHIIFGINFKSDGWQRHRKRWISSLAGAKGLAEDDPEVLKEIELIEKSIRASQDVFTGRNPDGTRQTLDDYVNFYPFKDDKATVTMVDGYNPGTILGKVQIERSRTNKSKFTVREIAQAKKDGFGKGKYRFLPIQDSSPMEVELDYRRPYIPFGEIPHQTKKLVSGENRPRFGYTILSRNHGFDAGGEGSSFIIWVGGKGILVDPSGTAIRQIERIGLTKDDIPYVLLTNNHAGNDRGLLKWLVTGKKVKLLTSFPVYYSFLKKSYDLLETDIEKAGYVEFVPLFDNRGNKVRLSKKKWATIQIRHNFYSIPAIGFIIDYRHKGRTYKIGFSGDTLYDTSDTANGGKLAEYKQKMEELGIEEDITQIIDKNIKYFFWDADGRLLEGIEVILHQAEARESEDFGIHTPIKTLRALPEWTCGKIDPYHMPESEFPIEGFKKSKPLETIAILESDEELRRSYRLQTIDSAALFAGMSKQKKAKLLEEGQVKRFPAAAELITEDTIAEDAKVGIAIILEGKAAVIKDDIVLTTVGKGTCVGEWALEMGQPRGATIKAAEGGLLALILTPAQYKELVSTPEVRRLIIKAKENLPVFQKLKRSTKLNNPFRELDYNALVDLATHSESMKAEDGKTIIRQGDKGGTFYVIKKGVVKIIKEVRDGDRTKKDIFFIRKGAYFGEIALLSEDRRRTATVIAEGDVELLKVKVKQFDRICNQWPSFDMEVRKEVERIVAQTPNGDVRLVRRNSHASIGKKYAVFSAEDWPRQSKIVVTAVNKETKDKDIEKFTLNTTSRAPPTNEDKEKIVSSAAQHKSLLWQLLNLFPRDIPLCIYEELKKDLFGFISSKHRFIALHKSLREDPSALSHEMLEYMTNSEVGLLKLEFEGTLAALLRRHGRIAAILRKIKIYNLIMWIARIGLIKGNLLIKDGRGRAIGEIPLKGEAMFIALKSIGEPYYAEKHYLIRALQRAIFGEKDKELTNKIKMYQRLNEAGLLDVYPGIKDGGYEIFGIEKNIELAETLEELTGVKFLVRAKEEEKKEVYSVYAPTDDSSLSFSFADAVTKEIDWVTPSLREQNRDDIRILVIGAGTGLDAMTAFHHAKVRKNIVNVHVDAIDINPGAIETTKYNLKLAGEAYQDAIHPRLVEEGKEFENLEGSYDLILFNAPNAIRINPDEEYKLATHMDENVFRHILEGIRDRLAPQGAALVRNLRNILHRHLEIIPSGLEKGIAEFYQGVLIDPEQVFFKFTLAAVGGASGPEQDPEIDIAGFDEEIIIEDAREDDAQDISRLSQRVKDKGGELDLDVFEVLGIIKRTQGKDRDKVHLRVYRANGKVVGYIYAVRKWNESLGWKGEKKLYIAHISVDEDYEHEGRARALFKDVFEQATKDGYRKIMLGTVHPFIIKIIEPFGFRYDSEEGFYVYREPTSVLFDDEKMNHIARKLVYALQVASKSKEEVLLALDTDLGEGEMNKLLGELIKVIPTLKDNNDDLKRIFGNLIVIKGTGRQLGTRLKNLTGSRGAINKENIIIITKNDNINKGHFEGLKGISTIASIDDSGLAETDYVPLLEVMLFAVSKYLGWPKEKLQEYYALIPNADQLTEEEFTSEFGEDKKTLVIRLIPNVTKFDKKELPNIMARWKEILKRA